MSTFTTTRESSYYNNNTNRSRQSYDSIDAVKEIVITPIMWYNQHMNIAIIMIIIIIKMVMMMIMCTQY